MMMTFSELVTAAIKLFIKVLINDVDFKATSINDVRQEIERKGTTAKKYIGCCKA